MFQLDSLMNVSFNISYDDNGYITRSAVKSNVIELQRRAFTKKRTIVRNDAIGAMQIISEALKQYGYAILRTVDAYLPFSIYWDVEFDIAKFQENGHFIMIISEDGDNYYFIDQLTEVMPGRFRHIPERKDIGVCRKEIFAEALSIYAKIITLDFDEENILTAEQFGNEILRISLKNYYENISTRGAINPSIKIGEYVILDQFIGFFQKHITFFSDDHFAFVDMTYPFCDNLRKCLADSCRITGVSFWNKGCYVGMDGPRYETAAEIRAMKILGGDVVGMTVAREAIMMREAGICYATVCLVTNMGAGINDTNCIHNDELFDIRKSLGVTTHKILTEAVRQLYVNSNEMPICHCTDTSNDFQ